MAIGVTELQTADIPPLHGKIYAITGANPAAAGVVTLGLNVPIKAVLHLGGAGATGTTGNIGNYVLNSSDGTEGTSTGNIYCTNLIVAAAKCYIWVLY